MIMKNLEDSLAHNARKYFTINKNIEVFNMIALAFTCFSPVIPQLYIIESCNFAADRVNIYIRCIKVILIREIKNYLRKMYNSKFSTL